MWQCSATGAIYHSPNRQEAASRSFKLLHSGSGFWFFNSVGNEMNWNWNRNRERTFCSLLSGCNKLAYT